MEDILVTRDKDDDGTLVSGSVENKLEKLVRKRNPMSFNGCSEITSFPVTVSPMDFATVSVIPGKKDVKPPAFIESFILFV